MKKKPPMPLRRLPVDFGDEPICVVPVLLCGDHPIASPPIALSFCSHPVSWAAFALAHPELKTQNSRFRRRAFTLVEILVVLALLSLIVVALMAVFNGTQRAFKASLTQTDILEGGRAVMDLIASDMEAMTPSDGISSVALNNSVSPPRIQVACPVNFSEAVTAFPSFPPSPLYQSLIGSPDNAQRENVLENIFILSKGNINGVSSWIATGYSVTTNLADGTLYPLYRFYMTTNVSAGFSAETNLFYTFGLFQFNNTTNWSHLMDGVVNLTVQTYDTNGVFMTNGYFANVPGIPFIPVKNATFVANGGGFTTCLFYSNAVPASVGIVMGTLEDHTLQHAEGLSGVNQSNYLAGVAGQVHLFSRRVWIRNLDPTAYQ